MYGPRHGPDSLGVAVHQQPGALGVLKAWQGAGRYRQHTEANRRAQHAVQRVRVQVCRPNRMWSQQPHAEVLPAKPHLSGF